MYLEPHFRKGGLGGFFPLDSVRSVSLWPLLNEVLRHFFLFGMHDTPSAWRLQAEAVSFSYSHGLQVIGDQRSSAWPHLEIPPAPLFKGGTRNSAIEPSHDSDYWGSDQSAHFTHSTRLSRSKHLT